jgi:hypothetical protein
MIKLRDTGTVSISSSTIAAGQSYTTEAFSTLQLEGGYSLEWTVTGDGTMKAEVLSSNGGVNFLDVNTDITSAQTKATGPAANGVNMADFSVIPCNMIKIKFSETGGASSITVVAKLRAF